MVTFANLGSVRLPSLKFVASQAFAFGRYGAFSVSAVYLQQFRSYSNYNCEKIVIFTYPGLRYVKTASFRTCGSNNWETVEDRQVHAARGLAMIVPQYPITEGARHCYWWADGVLCCGMQVVQIGGVWRQHEPSWPQIRRRVQASSRQVSVVTVCMLTCVWSGAIITLIVIIIQMSMFMVLSSWQSHCESSAGSFDECRTAPSGRRPSNQAERLGL